MQNDWYCQIDQQTLGPLSAEQLKRLAQAGSLSPTDLVRKTESGKWMSARLVKGLTFKPAVPIAPSDQPDRNGGDRDRSEDEDDSSERGKPIAAACTSDCRYCGNVESFHSFFTSGVARGLLIALFVLNFVIALIFWQFARRWHRCSWCGFSSPPKWDRTHAAVQPVILGSSLAAPVAILVPGLVFMAISVTRDQQVFLSFLLLLVLGCFLFGISAVLARQLRLNAIAWGLVGAITAGISTSALALWWMLKGTKLTSITEDSLGGVNYSRSVAREQTCWGYSPGLQQRIGLMIDGEDLLIISGPETLEKYGWPLIVGTFVVFWPLAVIALLLWMSRRYGSAVMETWYAFAHGDAAKVRSQTEFYVVVPTASVVCTFDGTEVRVGFPCSLLPKQPDWLPSEADNVKVQVMPGTLGASQVRGFVKLVQKHTIT